MNQACLPGLYSTLACRPSRRKSSRDATDTRPSCTIAVAYSPDSACRSQVFAALGVAMGEMTLCYFGSVQHVPVGLTVAMTDNGSAT